jgi:outer membrane autotransporter protein
MRASTTTKLSVGIAAVLTAASVTATELTSSTNVFGAKTAESERSLREIGRYLTTLCRGTALAAASTDVADLRARCTNLVNAAETGSSDDVARAVAGLKRLNSKEATSLQNTSLHVRSALSGFRGNGDLTSATPLAGNYNVPGAFGWSSGAAGDAASPWEAFVNGIYNSSDKDATPLAMGFKAHDVGVTGGMSYAVSDRFLMGVTLGYLSTNTKFADSSGTLDAEGIDYGVFASYSPTERLYLDGAITMNETNHDLTRNVSYSEPTMFGGSSVDQKMLASMDSDRIDFSATVGYQFLHFLSSGVSRVTTDLYARADYSDVDIDGYTETASAPSSRGAQLAVAIDPQQFNSLTATTGINVNGQWGNGDHPWYPYAMAEYTHEFESNNDPISGRFAIDPDTGARFKLPIDPGDKNYFSLGAGTTVALTDRVYGFFRYQGLIGYRGLTVHAFQVGLRQTF